MKILNKYLKISFLMLIMLIFLALINSKFLLIKFALFFTINTYSPGNDAIVVLSGSPMTRVPRAVELVKEGYGNQIFLTSTKAINKKFSNLEENKLLMAKNIADLLDFKKEIFLIPSISGGATSTFDEAYDVLDFAKQKNFKHIIIVTDFFHTRRALYAFRKIFKDSDVKIEISAAQNDIFNEKNWWRSEIGLSAYILEPIKLLIYIFSSANFKYVKNY